MKLIKGNGQANCKCRKCGVDIFSTDWKYTGDEGVFCYKHGRIEGLYAGFRIWMRRTGYAVN